MLKKININFIEVYDYYNNNNNNNLSNVIKNRKIDTLIEYSSQISINIQLTSKQQKKMTKIMKKCDKLLAKLKG